VFGVLILQFLYQTSECVLFCYHNANENCLNHFSFTDTCQELLLPRSLELKSRSTCPSEWRGWRQVWRV